MYQTTIRMLPTLATYAKAIGKVRGTNLNQTIQDLIVLAMVKDSRTTLEHPEISEAIETIKRVLKEHRSKVKTGGQGV